MFVKLFCQLNEQFAKTDNQLLVFHVLTDLVPPLSLSLFLSMASFTVRMKGENVFTDGRRFVVYVQYRGLVGTVNMLLSCQKPFSLHAGGFSTEQH